MAFAFELQEARHRPEECPGLAAPEAAAQLRTLIDLVPHAGTGSQQRNLHALD